MGKGSYFHMFIHSVVTIEYYVPGSVLVAQGIVVSKTDTSQLTV